MTAPTRPDPSVGERSRPSGALKYPLSLRLRPSRIAILLLLALHLMVAVALFRSSLSLWLVTSAVGMVALSLAYSLRAELRRGGRSICLGADGLLVEAAPPNADRSGRPVGVVDLGWAVWLRYEAVDADGRRRTEAQMLLPDNLDRDLWRSLRVWLRHKALMAPPGAGDD